jgi:hypothetical protein
LKITHIISTSKLAQRAHRFVAERFLERHDSGILEVEQLKQRKTRALPEKGIKLNKAYYVQIIKCISTSMSTGPKDMRNKRPSPITLNFLFELAAIFYHFLS